MLLVTWTVVTALGMVPVQFLPSPIQVLRTLWGFLASVEFFADVGISVFRVMTGFFAAAAVGIPSGIYMGSFRQVEAVFSPIIGFVRYLPAPAFIPLCILWLGLGELEKIAIIFIGTFFQLTLMVMDDVAMVPDEFVDIGKGAGLTSNQVVRRIITPAILPAVFDDLRICVGWAWSYLVVAEIVAANKGIGFLIMEGQRYLRTDHVMAGMLVIGILGVAFDAMFKLLRPILFPWVGAAHR